MQTNRSFVFANLSKLEGEGIPPKLCWVSTKYFPSHLKPCSLKSSLLAGINLYASLRSNLENFAPLPALFRAKLKTLAVPMWSLSSLFFSTLSLKLRPTGPDMLRIGLTFPFLTTTASGLALNPSIGAVSKGPATNPFLTHVAIVSVNVAPFS